MEGDVNQSSLNMAVEQGIPPSFGGSHIGYLFALFGLLMMTLLAFNWLWRVCWCLSEDPHPLRTPVTIARVVIMLLLVASILRGGPDALLLLQWPELSPRARLAVAETDRILDGIALIPFALAWVTDYLAGGVVQFQLKRLPPAPADLWPQYEHLKRPAKIAAGSLAIAFAVVFLQ